MDNREFAVQLLRCLKDSVSAPTLRVQMVGLDLMSLLDAIDRVNELFVISRLSQSIISESHYSNEVIAYLKRLTVEDFMTRLKERADYKNIAHEDSQKRFSGEKQYGIHVNNIATGIDIFRSTRKEKGGEAEEDTKTYESISESDFRKYFQYAIDACFKQESALIKNLRGNIFDTEALKGSVDIRKWFDLKDFISDVTSMHKEKEGNNTLDDTAETVYSYFFVLVLDFILTWAYDVFDKEDMKLYRNNSLDKKDTVEIKDLEAALDRIMKNGYIIVDKTNSKDVVGRIGDIMLEHLDKESVEQWKAERSDMSKDDKIPFLYRTACSEKFVQELSRAYSTISGVSDDELSDFVRNAKTEGSEGYSMEMNLGRELIYYKSPVYMFADEYAYVNFNKLMGVTIVIRYRNRKGIDKLYINQGVLSKDTAEFGDNDIDIDDLDNIIPQAFNSYMTLTATASSKSTFDVARCGENGIDCPYKSSCGYVKGKKNPCLCKAFMRNIPGNTLGIHKMNCFCSLSGELAALMIMTIMNLWSIVANPCILDKFTCDMMKHEAEGELEPLVMTLT